MARNPVVLIHGYSDKGESFANWQKILVSNGIEATSIYVGNYVSLSNEVTIKDLAEGLDRALRREAGLQTDEPFDAIVHSTGMLVIRSWLATYADRAQRARRLKRLIALAPATFGSPLAHKGRSWLGSIFKGERKTGPDFLEAGDEVLYGLELGSKFTWDLSHQDLVGENAMFTADPDSPYVFTFVGNKGYSGITSLVNPEGSDGTVRWAGCALNSRKITVDLMVKDDQTRAGSTKVEPWSDQDIRLTPIRGVDHGTILRKPTDEVIELVLSALKVEDRAGYTRWNDEAQARTADTLKGMRRWQQFVIRTVDERRDPVNDWNLQLYGVDGAKRIREFSLDVHAYQRDKSLRCFHVDLDKLLKDKLSGLHLKLIASSGSELVAYHGTGSERISPDGMSLNPNGKWDAQIDLSRMLEDRKTQFFFPFTTTLVEIILNREPMPPVGRNKVFWFVDRR